MPQGPLTLEPSIPPRPGLSVGAPLRPANATGRDSGVGPGAGPGHGGPSALVPTPKKRDLRSMLRRALRPPRRLRFTTEGKYFVAISIALGIAAINTGNNLLYLVLGWMLSVIVASGILSEASLRGLTVSRSAPQRIFAGRPFLMGLGLKNDKRRLASFSIEVEDLVGGRPIDKKCYFLKVPSGRLQQTSYRHTIARRGAYRFEGFQVSTKFPFALFRKSRLVEHAEEVVVLPALHAVTAPAAGALARGEEPRGQLGRRGEFFGLRELRDGDDRRDVHWRATARAGRMMVRELEDESVREAVIHLDNALPAKPTPAEDEALERAVSMAASLAAHYIGRGFAVRLIARGEQVGPGQGPAHLTRLLRALALLPTVADTVSFAGAPPARAQNIFVGRRGAARPPAGMTSVVEV